MTWSWKGPRKFSKIKLFLKWQCSIMFDFYQNRNTYNVKFVMWPFPWIFDLEWPPLTSRPLLFLTVLILRAKSRHFDIYLPYFIKVKNLTFLLDFWPRVTPGTSRPLFWEADVKSVILIFILATFNELRNLTLNDLKF